MANRISVVWGLSQHNTQIVAVTFDDEGDSGQAILYVLRPQLTACGWEKVWSVNVVGKSVQYLAEYPNVVLVDEFSGTGHTINKRVRDITNDYEGRPEKRTSTERLQHPGMPPWHHG